MTTLSIEWPHRLPNSDSRSQRSREVPATLSMGIFDLRLHIKLGITEVPVILCDDWSDGQVKAFRLLVNRSVTWAAYDLRNSRRGQTILHSEG